MAEALSRGERVAWRRAAYHEAGHAAAAYLTRRRITSVRLDLDDLGSGADAKTANSEKQRKRLTTCWRKRNSKRWPQLISPLITRFGD